MTRRAQSHLSNQSATLRGGFLVLKFEIGDFIREQFSENHLIVLLAFTSVHKRTDLGINLRVGPVGIEPTTEGL